jgi:hypothetical protein
LKNHAGRGCYYCSGFYCSFEKSIFVLRKDLLKLWDFKKNKISPKEISVSSGKKVWWKCPKGHEWQATIASRSSGNGCGRCTGVIATHERNLVTAFPHLSKELNYEKSIFSGFNRRI